MRLSNSANQAMVFDCWFKEIMILCLLLREGILLQWKRCWWITIKADSTITLEIYNRKEFSMARRTNSIVENLKIISIKIKMILRSIVIPSGLWSSRRNANYRKSFRPNGLAGWIAPRRKILMQLRPFVFCMLKAKHQAEGTGRVMRSIYSDFQKNWVIKSVTTIFWNLIFDIGISLALTGMNPYWSQRPRPTVRR